MIELNFSVLIYFLKTEDFIINLYVCEKIIKMDKIACKFSIVISNMFYFCFKRYLKKYKKCKKNTPNCLNIFIKRKICQTVQTYSENRNMYVLCLINDLPNNKVYIRNFNLYVNSLCIELLHYIKFTQKVRKILIHQYQVLFYTYFLFYHYFVEIINVGKYSNVIYAIDILLLLSLYKFPLTKLTKKKV